MRRGRTHDDRIPRSHPAALLHDPHDARAPNDGSSVGALEDRLKETRPEGFNLTARIAQPGHPNDRSRADADQRTRREPKKRKTASRDVLAHLTRFDRESSRAELAEQFGVQEMHLPKIGLGRILGDSGPMLDRSPEVRIVTHSVTVYELDAGDTDLGKRVVGASVYR